MSSMYQMTSLEKAMPKFAISSMGGLDLVSKTILKQEFEHWQKMQALCNSELVEICDDMSNIIAIAPSNIAKQIVALLNQNIGER